MAWPPCRACASAGRPPRSLRREKLYSACSSNDGDMLEPVVVVGCRAARASSTLDERILIGHEEHAVRLRIRNGWNSIALTPAAIAACPPRQTASVTIAVTVNPRSFRSTLRPRPSSRSQRSAARTRAQPEEAAAAPASLPAAARSSASAGHEGTCARTSRQASSSLAPRCTECRVAGLQLRCQLVDHLVVPVQETSTPGGDAVRGDEVTHTRARRRAALLT